MKGRARVFGHDITTDEIHPGRYYSTDPEILKKGLMAGIDKNFHSTVKPGDILVAGRYFGMGSGRESAVKAIKLVGIECIIAHSFSRYFFRNCINQGILPLVVRGVDRKIKEGDILEIDMRARTINNLTEDTVLEFVPLPEIEKI